MRCGVMSDRFEKSLSSASDLTDVRSLVCLPLVEALHAEWKTDAHFVPYEVLDEPHWPRLSKQGLAWVHEHKAKVVSRFLVLELDNPNHDSWDKVGLARQQELLERIAQQSQTEPVLSLFRFFYFSRGGCRIIYQLSDVLEIPGIESRWRWLIDRWRSAGFDGAVCDWNADDATCDWTRTWRLPKVIREGVSTAEEPYFSDGIIDLDQVLPLERLGTASKSSATLSSRAVKLANSAMPTPEQASDTMWVWSGSSKKPSDWARIAKGKLKGRECFPYIFEGQEMPVGQRDSTLVRIIGQAISLLIVLEQCTPERIFALFYELLCTLEPDEGTPDWFSSAWAKILRFYSQELGKLQAADVISQAKIQSQGVVGDLSSPHAKTVTEKMVEGMRKWCKSPPLHEDMPVAVAWMMRRVLVLAPKGIFMMNQDGRYEARSLTEAQVIPRLRISHMADLIQTTTITSRNTVADVKVGEIINAHATVVHAVVGVAGNEKQGGIVTGIDTTEASLEIPLYCRNESLTPTFNADVDAWLRQFFGDDYDIGARWIGHALAFEEGPICALSIKGDPGAGKLMLCQGLSECLARPRLAGAEDLIGDYSYGLLESPFLVIDEGWPKRSRFTRHPADAFRRLVSGDGLSAARKYESPIQVKSAVRVIFTANNMNVIKELSHGKTLSPQDRDALSQRLLHIDVEDRAKLWLVERGGMQLTARPGARWIAPAGGGESNYLVAKHFLWLHANRGEPDSGRFLVRGRQGASVMQALREESGMIPIISETIRDMAAAWKDLPKEAARPPGINGIFLDYKVGRIYITTGGIVEYYRHNLKQKIGEDVKIGDANDALETLCVKMAPYSWCPYPEKMSKKRWHEVDLTMVMQVLDSHGWESRQIADLFLMQVERKGGTYDEIELAKRLTESLEPDVAESPEGVQEGKSS